MEAKLSVADDSKSLVIDSLIMLDEKASSSDIFNCNSLHLYHPLHSPLLFCLPIVLSPVE